MHDYDHDDFKMRDFGFVKIAENEVFLSPVPVSIDQIKKYLRNLSVSSRDLRNSEIFTIISAERLMNYCAREK